MFVITAGLVACANGQNDPTSESYWVLLKDDGRTWCAYDDEAEFQAQAAELMSTESARVTFSDDRLSELTYQVEAESGDWVVVDVYTPVGSGVVLRRANLLAQENLQIIQEAIIEGANAGPFRILSTSTLDGQTVELPPTVDFPEVPTRSNFLDVPSVQVVGEMRSRSLGALCKEIE